MKEVISSALKIGAKCFVFSERFSTFVAPIFIALRVSQSDMTTQFCSENFGQAGTLDSSARRPSRLHQAPFQPAIARREALSSPFPGAFFVPRTHASPRG